MKGKGKGVQHGMSKTRTYVSWNSMWDRCNNHPDYIRKGITVEDSRWGRFENFLEDMGERPEGLELDRILNDRGYSKLNCRWTTRANQIDNRGALAVWCFNDIVKTLTDEQLANVLKLLQADK